jgi:uncharacterized membrane protein YbaN (DUF454 family)
MKRIVKITLGIFLILLGIVGLFLPILQGILFLLLGTLLLSSESKRVRRLTALIQLRYPKQYEKAIQLGNRIRRFFKIRSKPSQPNSEE